ncbi:peptidase M23 [Streptomyces sp. 4F14]|uniref:peptidase M23 n=1 Tax=Streptomyces sp. 4F14 TaxID=3394380 RepID=UPI003A836C0E
MKGLGKAAVGVTAAGVSVLSLCVLMIGGATVQANVNTCQNGLQPVGNGESGAGPEGKKPLFDGIQETERPQVTVPLRPEGEQNNATWTTRQVRNAATITDVARTRNLAPRAAVIAVAVAMQESTLDNLRHGDADSVGLFQQRPSQGWGTVRELTDPVHAAGTFYDRLVKVGNWQQKSLTKVAATVQRPAEQHRDEYAKWESAAGTLVAKTWGTHAVTSIGAGCDDPAASGGEDPRATFKSKNPRTAAQAIASARNEVGETGWYHLCDNFVAQAYGWGSSGSATANVHWNRLVDAGLAHPGDMSPPAGALLFYDTGSDAGHVALYLGRDQVASNDIKDDYRRQGKIAIVSRKELTDGTWRLRYRGWAEPSFPSAGGISTLPLLPDKKVNQQ